MTTTAGWTGQNRSNRRCRRRDHQALHAAVADLKAACTPPQPSRPPPIAAAAARRAIRSARSPGLRRAKPSPSEDGPASRRHPLRRRSQIGRATTRLGVRPTPETRERGDPPPPPSAPGLSPAASSGGGGGRGGGSLRRRRLGFWPPESP
nr:translation initiation factor IF-2-like [Aegilops tauschii subsp. strangulata]